MFSSFYILFADLRLEHISCEAAEHTYLRSVNWFYSGNIEISNVHIFPNYYNNEHFLFLVISGSKVFATEGGKMKSNGGIYFSKKITIPYLQSDFKLHLLVYSVTSKVCSIFLLYQKINKSLFTGVVKKI